MRQTRPARQFVARALLRAASPLLATLATANQPGGLNRTHPDSPPLLLAPEGATVQFILLLTYKADRRTLLYMSVTTALFIVQWNLARLQPLLYLWYLFMAVSVAIIAHNHNHVPMWRSRFLNIATDYWLTLFYGFPAFGWIPTHNKNHHLLNNKQGDYTLTYRLSEKNNIFTLLSYPSVSSYFQQEPIAAYLKTLWRSNRPKFHLAASQYLVLGLYYAVALLWNWKNALLFIVIPHQVSLFSVLIFNYVQHVHTDEESEFNHARNFTGLINQMLFNNGYHTIHHQAPGIHWSQAPAAQRKIESLIDPSLNERSFWWYIARVYLLAPFYSPFRSVSLRLRRINAHQSGAASRPIS
jgi:fatty acid desaturase